MATDRRLLFRPATWLNRTPIPGWCAALNDVPWIAVASSFAGTYSTYHADMADGTKPREPWIDPNPQPGDFDTELDRARPNQIEIHEGNPDAKLSIIVSVEGDDAKR